MALGSNNPFPSLLLVEQGSTPASPASGDQRLFIKTSDHLFYTVNSAGTVTAVGGGGGGGGGDYVKLAETTVTGSVAANIDFTSISGSYKHLRILLTGRGDQAANQTNVQVQFNADTSTHYYTQYCDFYSGGSADGGAATASASGIVGRICAANATANAAGTLSLDLHNYAGTTFAKIANGIYAFTDNGPNGLSGVAMTHWSATPAAITEVKLFPASGNFAVGTIATLFGIN